MPYQNIPRFEPAYGNRYGFRQRTPAPSTGPATQPVPGSPAAPPVPTPAVEPAARPADYHSGPSAESGDDGGIDNAAGVRGAAARSQGHQYGQTTPGQFAQGLLGFVPGGGLLGGLAGPQIDEASNFGGIPAHERFGAPGTIDRTSGGVFSADGRAYDPVTGQALNSYSNRDSFLGGQYVQGIRDNPFSLDSYLGDPANAPSYTAANQAREAGALGAQGFEAALRNEGSLYADDPDTGNYATPEERALLAQHVGQTEYGFEEHTVAPDTATNQAIQGIGYSPSGAATAGSQFSSTGTFSTGTPEPAAPPPAAVNVPDYRDDNNDSDGGSQTGSETSHSGGYGGFADDAAVSDSGGGGGGGK